MTFPNESAGTLRRLADALQSGQLTTPLTTFGLQRVTSVSPDLISELKRLSTEGMSAPHLALLLSAAAETREARAGQASAELVWTGPELPGVSSRDTSVVVRELWAQAEFSTFVVQSIETVFQPLAQRMAERPELRVRLFLHIGRNLRDTSLDSELLRELAANFSRRWSGDRRPEVYYDPRGLSTDSAVRATWHAKCVVVDDELAFVTSANFTEWGQDRNVEAGVLVRSRSFNAQLRQQFDSLVRARLVVRLAGI